MSWLRLALAVVGVATSAAVGVATSAAVGVAEGVAVGVATSAAVGVAEGVAGCGENSFSCRETQGKQIYNSIP